VHGGWSEKGYLHVYLEKKGKNMLSLVVEKLTEGNFGLSGPKQRMGEGGGRMRKKTRNLYGVYVKQEDEEARLEIAGSGGVRTQKKRWNVKMKQRWYRSG